MITLQICALFFFVFAVAFPYLEGLLFAALRDWKAPEGVIRFFCGNLYWQQQMQDCCDLVGVQQFEQLLLAEGFLLNESTHGRRVYLHYTGLMIEIRQRG